MRSINAGNSSSAAFRRSYLNLEKKFSMGIQVRRIGRQVDNGCASFFNGFANTRHLVAAQIVCDHDVSGTQRWAKNTAHIFQERSPFMGPSKSQGASIPSWRMAAMNVLVCQCPRGA